MPVDGAATVASPRRATTAAGRSPGTVVARLTARRAVRSGALWGSVFGLAVASSALTYTSFYKTPAARRHLAATFGNDHSVNALYGPAPQLQTAAGFAVFKTSMTLMLLGAVWGLLTSTRLLRGEEDAGRWELLLTGATTRRRAAAQAWPAGSPCCGPSPPPSSWWSGGRRRWVSASGRGSSWRWPWCPPPYCSWPWAR